MLSNMSRRGLLLTVLMSALMPAAYAHGPTRQKVTDEIEISAPPSAVWAVLGDFSSIAQWHPAVASSPASKGSEVGSVRTLTLKSGAQVVEELEALDKDSMTLKYRAQDGGALPVSNYSSTMIVSAAGSGSKVVWRGAFYRAYQNNNPPPEQNDEAAVKAITEVYKSGLAGLKALVEKK